MSKTSDVLLPPKAKREVTKPKRSQAVDGPEKRSWGDGWRENERNEIYSPRERRKGGRGRRGVSGSVTRGSSRSESTDPSVL